MTISYIDILILLPLLIGLVRGLMRGLVTELVAILAVILGVVGARVWAPDFTAWLQCQFTWPEAVCRVVAYTLLFLAIAIVCNLFGRWFSKLLRVIKLGWLNRLLGGLFGTLKWAIIVLLVILAISTLDERFGFIQPDVKNMSVCYEKTVDIAHDCLSIARSELGK